MRKEHAQPLLEQLKTFLETSLRQVSGKSALAQAIRYALTRWKALTCYVLNGRLEMSNNAAERAMRPPVLGRKNYLFCGSDAGGGSIRAISVSAGGFGSVAGVDGGFVVSWVPDEGASEGKCCDVRGGNFVAAESAACSVGPVDGGGWETVPAHRVRSSRKT